MSSTIKQILKDVTFKVLETMFFSLPEPCDASPNEDWDLYAGIKLQGPEEITLHLFLHKELAVKLAADFLGTEHEEIAAEALLDMMKEMVNMIGGNLLTRLDSQTCLSLGVPESRFVTGHRFEKFREENQIAIQVNDKFMRVAWNR